MCLNNGSYKLRISGSQELDRSLWLLSDFQNERILSCSTISTTAWYKNTGRRSFPVPPGMIILKKVTMHYMIKSRPTIVSGIEVIPHSSSQQKGNF